MITSHGEERAYLSAFPYVCSICARLDLSVPSSVRLFDLRVFGFIYPLFMLVSGKGCDLLSTFHC